MTKKMRDLENAGYVREYRTTDKTRANEVAVGYRANGYRAQVVSVKRTSSSRNSVRTYTEVTYYVWVKAPAVGVPK